MNDLDERLSVIMDEYTGNDDCQAVLDEVVSDVNLQYKLRRYQMIGDVMRHELPERINLDLSHQIMAEVKKIHSDQLVGSESQPASTERTSFWAWARLKPFAGLAVTATVAVVSVGLWQSASIVSDGSEPTSQSITVAEEKKIQQLVDLPVQGSAVAVSSSLDKGMRWSIAEDSPALQQKLNGYLVNHTEYSIPMQSLIPQARVAGYDSQQ